MRPDPLTVPDPLRRELEQVACRLAVEAGQLILQGRPEHLGVARTKTTPLDVVTEMDQASERLLRERLAELRPEDGILGEEEGLSPGTSGLSWVVDPIDGTVNYLYGLPGYAVSVAVVVGDPATPGAWSTVAGAVVNPALGELFHARAGGGAWLRRADLERPSLAGAAFERHCLEGEDHASRSGIPRRLSCTTIGELSAALLATGFSYDPRVKVEQGALVADLLPRVRDVRRLGAAAVDLCHVAAGRVDGYFERCTHAWDMAAGMLIVREAGGVVSGRAADEEPSEDLLVAAGTALHGPLRAEVARLGRRGVS